MAQIVLLQCLYKGNVDDVNTYGHRGEHPSKSGKVEDEGRGGKIQTRVI
jgi:hypothetical protein